MKPYSLLILCFFIMNSLFPQEAAGDSAAIIKEGIFDENIKTVLFHRAGWDLAPPLIMSGSDEKLELSFDLLYDPPVDFSYTIIHCNARWEPSDLQTYEYIEGYTEEDIYDYSSSRNTIIPYTHYRATFPTGYMEPKIPGNYIMEVYDAGTGEVYFTRRFMVAGRKVSIEGSVKRATVATRKQNGQEVDFVVDAGDYRIHNGYENLTVVVRQNGRYDNAITDLKPRMIVGNRFDYNYERENVFEGGNEFRYFDLKNLDFPGEGVAATGYGPEGYTITLKPDEKRSFRVYKTEKDINGKMKPDRMHSGDPATEAEYAYVGFFLSFAAPVIDGEVHILGALTDWGYTGLSRMDYDYKKKGYTKELLLKQGYYNYLYALVPHGSGTGDVTYIEGSHWETENSYSIEVYYKDPLLGSDLLIGVKHLSSLPE